MLKLMAVVDTQSKFSYNRMRRYCSSRVGVPSKKKGTTIENEKLYPDEITGASFSDAKTGATQNSNNWDKKQPDFADNKQDGKTGASKHIVYKEELGMIAYRGKSCTKKDHKKLLWTGNANQIDIIR
ncbi:hypothetical protein [Lentilactobacillus hilgardii]|uniref:hypothetical protein n=1 Tax=Lentilactobacillus hilgardii TaxID=1588 RepID=UPI0021C262A7|nr:hypothetical protein [Lentilactobacillus hilgardii]